MQRILVSTVLALLGACALPLVGQESANNPIISTDRPSVGTGPDLAPVHWFIAENGIGFAGRGGNSTVDWPETLLRYGLSRRLELRVQTPNMEQLEPEAGLSRQDGSVSAKVGLPSSAAWPVSTIVSLSVPIGSQNLTSGGWDPALLFATSHTWTPRLSSFASVNAAWISHGPSARQQATQLAFDGLWKLTEAVTTYVEWAPLVSANQNASGYTADTGAMWVLAKRTQLDTRVGATVGSSGVTVFAGFGYSFSFQRPGFVGL